MKINKIIKKSLFVNSFKLDKRFWQVLLLDLALVIIVLSLIASYTFTLRSNLDEMKELDDSVMKLQEKLEAREELNPLMLKDMELISSTLNKFLLKMIPITLIFLIALIAITGYFKVKEWCIITKEKFNKHIVLKLSLLIITWNSLWILLFFFIVFALKFQLEKIQLIAIIETFLYIYFSIILMPIFFKSKKVWRTVKETFTVGSIKFHAILPSILAIWIILVILLNLTMVFAPNLFIFIMLPLSLLYLTWIRFYINAIINKTYN